MIEEEISRQMLTAQKDKTFSDKVLAKEEVEKIRNLIKKKDLTREDLQDILYLMVGTEQKLMNYGTWDRYFLTKYFVWIRSFFETIEHYYDYQDKLKSNFSNKKCSEEETIYKEEIEQMYDQLMNLWVHTAKFLIDLYLHLSRSTLSVGGSAFTEILRNKYEISYPDMQKQSEEKKGLFRW